VLKEWDGYGPGTQRMVWTGVAILVIATMVIGAGNRMNEM
jgi:hypothetical protein